MARVRNRGPETPKVLFILGVERSGSTLLDQVVGTADGVCSTGELRALWGAYLEGDRCGCGESVSACPFWTAVLSEMFGSDAASMAERMRGIQEQEVRTRPRSLLRLWRHWRGRSNARHVAQYAAVLADVYRTAARVADARVVIDSSKSASKALIAASSGVDLHILHLIRDPRAVAYSWLHRPMPGASEDVATATVSRWAGFHLRSTRLTRAYLSTVFTDAMIRPFSRGRFMTMRYEDFVADPRVRFAEIAEFIGERDIEPPFIDAQTVEMGTNHILDANRSKFRRGPTPIRLDSRWRSSMPRSTQAVLTAMSAPLLLRYRYLPSVP